MIHTCLIGTPIGLCCRNFRGFRFNGVALRSCSFHVCVYDVFDVNNHDHRHLHVHLHVPPKKPRTRHALADAPPRPKCVVTPNFSVNLFLQSSSHNRGMSSSSVDMTMSAAAATGVAPSERSTSTDLGSSGSSEVSPLMVDTSAAARAAAAGVGVNGRGVRPPPVTVTGGGHRIPIDPSNKALLSSPLTPRSSMEAAAMAAAAAAAAAAASAAMPPPPKREQREELGLVEQLTNMVEVFDICDLLRKVSTSNSSRLDKHGGIVKPAGAPQHMRNMSVDTDQGLPQSPLQGRDGQGSSPTGLGSLESMELVRESSKDWDTLMAGSADVSDLGNTMVQSVAEFFSF